MTETLRQVIHDHMAQIAAGHAAGRYRHLDGDTAAQLFALLADNRPAYLMEARAGPGQSLAAASGLTAKDALLAGLAEDLDLKNRDPGMAPAGGWLTWRPQRAGGCPGHPARQAAGRGAAAGHRPRGGTRPGHRPGSRQPGLRREHA